MGQTDIQEYFEWMSQQQWQEYLDAEIQKTHNLYGYGVHARLKIAEFLSKNCEI